MAAYTQSYYRALLVPDWRYNGQPSRGGVGGDGTLWAAQSSYTEAGPHPGQAIDGQWVAGNPPSAMTLDTLGEYVSTAANLYVGISRGGHATRTGDGAHMTWTTEALLGSKMYGWDRPATVVGQDLLDATASLDESRAPCLLTIPSSGKVICAYQSITDATASASFTIKTRTRAPSTGTWAAAVTVYSGSTDYSSAVAATVSNHGGPCLVLLPGERVLCLVLHEDTPTDTLTVRAYYSDDDGATWYLGSPSVLPAVIDTATYTIRKISAAYLDGQILMLLWRMTPGAGPSDVLVQYASSDHGASFVVVGSTVNAGLPCVVAADGRYVVAYVPRSGETRADDACWSVLASAWAPLSDEYTATSGTKISTVNAAAYDGSSNIDQASKLALCVDEQGILYAYWGATDVYGAIQDGTLAVSTGVWEPLGANTGQTMFTFAAGDYLREIAACCQRGRVLLAGSNTASTATTDSYLACWYLGGYTTIELPAYTLAPPWWLAAAGAYASIPCTWAPIELPQNTGWTAAGTAATEAIGTSGTAWELTVTTSANVRHYTISPTASTSGLIATGVVRCNTATSRSGRLKLVASGGGGGADDYTLIVDVDQTNIAMYDDTTVRQTAAHGLSSGKIQILAAVNSGKASVWYRSYSTLEPTTWIALGTNETITAASKGTTNAIQFGTNDATNADYDVSWMLVGHVSGANVGQHLATGAPSTLHGRPLGSLPVYVSNGLSVRASGGPAVGTGGPSNEWDGDYWIIPPRYDYGVENLDPRISPSPRDTWRSTQAAADESIAYKLDLVATAQGPSGLVGIHLENCNMPTVQLQFYSGGWSTLGTLTMAKKVAYTRTGETFAISFASAGWTGVLRQDELVGGALQLGTTNAATVRRITHSTAGTVQSSGSPRVPQVYCSGVTAGDSASGTGYLWFPRGTYVISAGAVQGLRILVDDTATYSDPPEGYFEIGAAVVGPVYLLGMDPDATRTIGRMANVEVREDRSRRTRSRVLGPVRRTVSMSWSTPGVDLGPVYDLGDDTISDTTPTVVALRHDAPIVLQGLFDANDGPSVPMVYLPNVAAGFAGEAIVQGQIYGRLDDRLDTSTVLGEEDDTEVVTFSVSLTEEV